MFVKANGDNAVLSLVAARGMFFSNGNQTVVPPVDRHIGVAIWTFRCNGKCARKFRHCIEPLIRIVAEPDIARVDNKSAATIFMNSGADAHVSG